MSVVIVIVIVKANNRSTVSKMLEAIVLNLTVIVYYIVMITLYKCL